MACSFHALSLTTIVACKIRVAGLAVRFDEMERSICLQCSLIKSFSSKRAVKRLRNQKGKKVLPQSPTQHIEFVQVVHEEPRTNAAKALKKQHLDCHTHGGMESSKG